MSKTLSKIRRFAMVDVFARTRFSGNPLPVVIDAEGLDTDAMMRITRWFNQSETTFLLPPQDPQADYRVRIFTLERELPFAGHPTLGSCRVWLDQGGAPKDQDIIQECGLGLLPIRAEDKLLSLAAPPLLKSGPVHEDLYREISGVLNLDTSNIEEMVWADNGPGWIAVQLASASEVLALQPARHHHRRLEIGVLGPYPPGHEFAYEVRTFFSDAHGNLLEDPVTGSFNASAAQWQLQTGRVKGPYLAHQGQCLGRSGRVHVAEADGEIWIGGEVQSLVTGTLIA